MSEAQSERRGAPRAAADLPLQLSTTAAAQPAWLKDISQSGLCCRFDQPVSEMTMMGVDLVLPDSEPHRVQGVVVRCEKDREREAAGYEVAIYFTELEPAARRAITDFVALRS